MARKPKDIVSQEELGATLDAVEENFAARNAPESEEPMRSEVAIAPDPLAPVTEPSAPLAAECLRAKACELVQAYVTACMAGASVGLAELRKLKADIAAIE